ncbi:MAG: DUF262 domain-containing protein [Phycisphaerae bacterium]|nr:DUF262 domain-containing protein [Phycisphaerae bacterium]
MKTKILQRESNKLTIAEFYQNYLLGKYSFDPPYQRKSVWTEEKQSFLIDTVLKNFPMPPIFLHQKIDDKTGQTTYDVIDGKQRLSSIIAFIENEIPVTNEHDEENEVAGKYFNELDAAQLKEYKQLFWRYNLTIEYVDTVDKALIDGIFDRLNRNGEPLTGQELRHANYYNTHFWKFIEQKNHTPFWKSRLERTEVSRMADLEFISEITFVILENSELDATDTVLDGFYEKYRSIEGQPLGDLTTMFDRTTNYLERLSLNYENLKINGVSHLYGLWCFARKCVMENVTPESVKDRIENFYNRLRTKDYDDANILEYKQSMSSRTKSKVQRERRTAALLKYCGINIE